MNLDPLLLELAKLVGPALAGSGAIAPWLIRARRAVALAEAALTEAKAGDVKATAGGRIADAAATLLEQTGALLPSLIQQVGQQEARILALGQRLDAEHADHQALRSWIVEHATWDRQAIEAVAAAGGKLEPPAPPPIRKP